MDRFFKTHPDIEPEEIRWHRGAWRVVPNGKDKEVLAEWIAGEMAVNDCERLIYMLCVLRNRLRLTVPRHDLDQWRTNLSHEDPECINAIIARSDGSSAVE